MLAGNGHASNRTVRHAASDGEATARKLGRKTRQADIFAGDAFVCEKCPDSRKLSPSPAAFGGVGFDSRPGTHLPSGSEGVAMATGVEHVPRLVVIDPAELDGTALVLSRPEMVIGHSDTADLVLDDRLVSCRYALIAFDDSGSVMIHDLNSTGGTFVNDAPLEGPRVLRRGDLVRRRRSRDAV